MQWRKVCRQLWHMICGAQNELATGNQHIGQGLCQGGTRLSVKVDEEIAAENQVIAGLIAKRTGSSEVSTLEADALGERVVDATLVVLEDAAGRLERSGHLVQPSIRVDSVPRGGECARGDVKGIDRKVREGQARVVQQGSERVGLLSGAAGGRENA
jgi:hypothetical protein